MRLFQIYTKIFHSILAIPEKLTKLTNFLPGNLIGISSINFKIWKMMGPPWLIDKTNKNCACNFLHMVTSSFDKLEQWKSKLASLTELILPTDYPRPIPYRIVESEYLHNLSEPSSLALMKLILELDGSPSPFGVLLALFSILLSKYTGESDITVGSSSTNNNLFILRMDISEQRSLLDTIRNVLKVRYFYSGGKICTG